MPFAAVLYFDQKNEQEFLSVWRSLSRKKLSANLEEAEIRPHITLAVFDELDCRPCESELARIAHVTRSISFQVTHFGLFTNPEPVVFAAPIFTKMLFNLHKQIHNALLVNAKNPWKFYQPDQWVPHCTLAIGFSLKNIGKIIHECMAINLPMLVQATQVGIVEFQPMKDIFRYDLSID